MTENLSIALFSHDSLGLGHIRRNRALAFALAAALFGTFTPLVSTWLIDMTGNRAAPGFWLMAAAASGLIATILIYRGRSTPLVRH